MWQQISFYKKENRWYADLPAYISAGGTEADCVMVAGADTLIDKLCENMRIMFPVRMFVEIDTQPFTVNSKTPDTHIKLEDIKSTTEEFLLEYNHPKVDFGGHYIADIINGVESYHKLWLCPVTLHVFPNGYPESLWIRTGSVLGYADKEYHSFELNK